AASDSDSDEQPIERPSGRVGGVPGMDRAVEPLCRRKDPQAATGGDRAGVADQSGRRAARYAAGLGLFGLGTRAPGERRKFRTATRARAAKARGDARRALRREAGASAEPL